MKRLTKPINGLASKAITVMSDGIHCAYICSRYSFRRNGCFFEENDFVHFEKKPKPSLRLRHERCIEEFGNGGTK